MRPSKSLFSKEYNMLTKLSRKMGTFLITVLILAVLSLTMLENLKPGVWQAIRHSLHSHSDAIAASPEESPAADACCPPAGAKAGVDPCCPAPDAKVAEEPCCPKCAAKKEVSQGDAPVAPIQPVIWTAELVAKHKAEGDWCKSHGVPESMCTLCNPALVASYKTAGDWCGGHQLPESICYLCNKELVTAGLGQDWCEQHGLPTSQCVLCNPQHAQSQPQPVSLQEQALSELAAKVSEETTDRFNLALIDPTTLWNKEGRTGINPNCPLHHTTIRLNSPTILESAGFALETVTPRKVTEAIECYGDIQYDRSRYALLSPRASGTVRTLEVELGRQVSSGTVLMRIDSADFGKAKADYLRAQSILKRCQWLVESLGTINQDGVVARRELVEAKADLDAALVEVAITQQNLLNYGLEQPDLERIATDRETSGILEIKAPFSGTIVDLKAVPGESVVTDNPVLALADLTQMWLCLDLPSNDLAQIKPDMMVRFQPDQSSLEPITGKINWISSEVDTRTRTGKVYVEVENASGNLRAGQFGMGTITILNEDEVLTVPEQAVQWDGCCNVVFVQQAADVYEPRKVRLGTHRAGFYTVQAGVMAGERVVTQGSYLMKTEILKDSIGAGCCAEE
jgi:cobalt-zinc-cadmium efflux system membrane fusion protein